MNFRYGAALAAALFFLPSTIATSAAQNTPAPGPPAQPAVGPNAQSMSSPNPGAPLTDLSFSTQMSQSGLAEVQMAQLALKQSTNPKVQAFAKRMIADHTQNNQQLKSVAMAAGVGNLPNDIGPANSAQMQQLQGLSGSAFDRAYLQSQVQAHQIVASLLRSEIAQGTNNALKTYAQSTLPTIQSHLQMAQQDLRSL